ncbi:hypothetical protein ACQEPB_04295 [Novosphingobium fluoreni]|uniref:hypothetical protein n=1 Tax=Novosphingobium fluoreni TaxID=1391222 RepID=UPI003DA0F872
MNPLAAATSGIKKDRDTTVRYEVHRMREAGPKGVARAPLVEEFLGLDRARLAAFAHALDGPTPSGDRFTGLIRIVQALYTSGVRCRSEVVDEVDERVASRLLNEVRLPKAGQLAVTIAQLQGEVGLVTVLCRSLESLRLVQGDRRDDQA